MIIPAWRSQSCSTFPGRLCLSWEVQGWVSSGGFLSQCSAPLVGFFWVLVLWSEETSGMFSHRSQRVSLHSPKSIPGIQGLHEHSSEGTHGLWSLRLPARTTLTQSPVPAFSNHFSFQYSWVRSLVRILLYPATNSCGSLVWLLETDLLLEWNIVCTPCLAGCLGTTERSLGRGCESNPSAWLHVCALHGKHLPLISAFLFSLLQISLSVYPVRKQAANRLWHYWSCSWIRRKP